MHYQRMGEKHIIIHRRKKMQSMLMLQQTDLTAPKREENLLADRSTSKFPPPLVKLLQSHVYYKVQFIDSALFLSENYMRVVHSKL